jgi:hypothetical protein
VELVIGVVEIQEGHVGLILWPPNGASKHRIIQSIVSITTLRHQSTPAAVGVELTVPALTHADLQITLQVSIAKVFPFVIGQQIDGFVGMPEAESTFISLQIALYT